MKTYKRKKYFKPWYTVWCKIPNTDPQPDYAKVKLHPFISNCYKCVKSEQLPNGTWHTENKFSSITRVNKWILNAQNEHPTWSYLIEVEYEWFGQE